MNSLASSLTRRILSKGMDIMLTRAIFGQPGAGFGYTYAQTGEDITELKALTRADIEKELKRRNIFKEEPVKYLVPTEAIDVAVSKALVDAGLPKGGMAKPTYIAKNIYDYIVADAVFYLDQLKRGVDPSDLKALPRGRLGL